MKKRRTLYAYYRFARHLLHEFRWPLGVFFTIVLGGGLLFKMTYREAELTIGEACYDTFLMIFVQNPLRFPTQPNEWWLKPLFFIIPITGLGAVADSVVRLGYFIFTAKQKLPEWHRMNASAMKNHIIVCGVGKVGYRILEELLALKEDVVAIERNNESPLVEEMIGRGVTIIIGECRLRKTLEEANVAHARAVILATNDDLANIDAALTAREIKPGIRVVLRMFDDTMASKVAPAFGMPAISTSSAAATAFICAVTERNIFQSIQLGAQRLHVADLIVSAGHRLVGRTVGELQRDCSVNIVMHMSNGRTEVNPSHASKLCPEDHLIVISDLGGISKLEEMNR